MIIIRKATVGDVVKELALAFCKPLPPKCKQA